MYLILAKIMLGFWMVLVLLGAFIYAPAAMGLGDLSRIIYFHVPLAWVGVLAYFVSMINSVGYLRKNNILYDLKAAVNAEIGLIFTIMATVTGAIFARNTWGVYWNWDPRQTSIFVLFLIYGSYFVLRSAVEDEEKRARFASVFSIFAFTSVPFLVFIIPRVYATLHPDPILNLQPGIQMDSKMFFVFLASLVGFTGIYVWMANLGSRLVCIAVEAEGDVDND
jgi:heme exporter protein C